MRALFLAAASMASAGCIPDPLDVGPLGGLKPRGPGTTSPRRGVLPPGCGLAPGKAAVSLTYDDSLASQLEIAAPDLDRLGLLGTFFVTGTSSHADSWRALAARGHELAAHTVRHPCARANAWVKPGDASEDYTLARMTKELSDQAAMLDALGQPRPFTFAYPCGETTVGAEHTSYIPLIRQRFLAARGASGGVASKGVDLALVPGQFSTGSGEELIALVASAVAQGGWLVLGFHGVGGDHLSVSREAHAALLAYLATHTSTVVTAPFGTIAACMAADHR